MSILITGAAGFIGAALAHKILKNGFDLIGIDNLNGYYDVNLKLNRIKSIESKLSFYKGKWIFKKCDLTDIEGLTEIFSSFKPSIVINLAAQAGVRYSIENPESYIKSNLLGFSNILEQCRKNEVSNLIYASSSSVYGSNKKLPFHEEDEVNHPVSLYAATKRSNEFLAHSYSHLYGIPATGLRFFTVYGPWGRPDMAPMIFTKSIFDKEPINIFNYGNMKRDFTYIDDIVEAVFKCCFKKAEPNKNFDPYNPELSTSFAPHRIFNLGNSKSIKLMRFIEILENIIGMKALKNYVEMPLADVEATESDITQLQNWIDFKPKTKIERGLEEFINWYKIYYNY